MPPKYPKFDGIIREYPNISVDCFGEKNLHSSAYFLSHCHLDHMRGISSKTFAAFLETKPSCYIYCSEATEKLLQDNALFRLSPILLSKLKSLSIGDAHLIEFEQDFKQNQASLTVTLLPASHCLGSVMFLFDGDNGRVLYTGDFRFYKDQLDRCDILSSLAGSIDNIYLDATFAHSNAVNFPTREDVIKSCCRFIKKWLEKNSKGLVYFDCPYRFGYEQMFVEMEKVFAQKTHVTSAHYGMYHSYHDIRNSICDGNESFTKFHSCDPKCRQVVSVEPTSLLSIRLCAQAFVINPTTNPGKKRAKIKENQFRYCFSMHSSLSELQNFLSILKPKNVVLCAFPSDKDPNEILREFGYPKRFCISASNMVNFARQDSSAVTPCQPSMTAEKFVLNTEAKETSQEENSNCISDLLFDEDFSLPTGKRLKL